MGSNTFGNIFKITTWGESHGKAIGVVIDGCPAGLEISESDIQAELSLRAPGKNTFTSPRVEKDQAEILSGIFDGKTTGAPISIIIYNQSYDSKPYETIKNILRPGHANFTYLQKYGIYDHRGGGRASARETACRVAAGAIAKKWLEKKKIEVFAFISQIADIQANIEVFDFFKKEKNYQNPLYCPDKEASIKMSQLLEEVKKQGDSLGGVVTFVATNVPSGLGDPIYEKLEANLAKAMLSIPASKGFEIGDGFQSVLLKGSEHNDPFAKEKENVITTSNHAGGILGGISNGMPIIGKVAFKPTSSIKKSQKTLNLEKQEITLKMAEESKHDPCVAIRAVPVVEAMLAICLVDAILLNRCSKV
ncbi:Chorismate synthase [Candidatus Rubidus massiliensis]|nr:Chorismate synthase [Candidatus Rubidus massiliensis]